MNLVFTAMMLGVMVVVFKVAGIFDD